MQQQRTEMPTGWVRNIQILLELLASWWLPTAFVGSALVGLSVWSLYQEYKLTGVEIGIATFGTLAGFAFLKATWLLMFYRPVYRSKFEGSFFVMAALVTSLLLMSLAVVAYLGRSRTTEFPFAELPWLFLGTYVYFTFVLWLAFRFSNWVFGRKQQ